MIIGVILLGFYLFMSLGVLIYIMQYEGYSHKDILAILLFIFLPPIWAIIKFIYYIKEKRRKKSYKRRDKKTDAEIKSEYVEE